MKLPAPLCDLPDEAMVPVGFVRELFEESESEPLDEREEGLRLLVHTCTKDIIYAREADGRRLESDGGEEGQEQGDGIRAD